ncbi:MAG: VCBS repeat-containing protein, partial [Acidobacteriota bacterium]
ADLDGDGAVDIVLGNKGSAGTILQNQGTGRAFKLLRFGDPQGAIYGLALGDVDGDGLPDIVAARSGAPNSLYLNSLR